jgi:hypothetical protein
MAVGAVTPQRETSFSQIPMVLPRRDAQVRSNLENYFKAVEDESNLRGKGYDSYFEAVVAEGLKKAGIEFRHAKWSAFLRRAGDDPFLEEGKYVPDFITKFLIGDRIVAIEPHGGRCFDERSYQKYAEFTKERGDRFYFIIITDMTKERMSFNLKTRHIDKMADEIWHVPSYKKNPVGKKGGRKINEPTEADVDEILHRIRGLQLREMRRERAVETQEPRAITAPAQLIRVTQNLSPNFLRELENFNERFSLR